ncbi:MAG TPA: Hsp20/alpha crystallin family protein [Nitrospiraceae bacterium]|nr:Hsp20/alpha crystallin family protein [Nitrospiraceae bacterium]
MNQVRFDPLRELAEMTERLNRMIGRAAATGQDGNDVMTRTDWTPPVDIIEGEDQFLIKAELPEVKKNDVKVTVANGVLTLQGERKEPHVGNGHRFHRSERSYGRFARSFSLPDQIDESKVRAEHKDGMLTISLPKSKHAKPKTIEVKVS